MSNAITRRQLMGTGAAGLCALALGGRLAAAQGRKRPNVLIITTDQQRVDAMSAVGNKWVKTPNMDSIAANGVYFTNSYCPYPLCSPSRSSLHTGRMPHEIGVDRNNVPIDPRSRSRARSSAPPATTPATPASGTCPTAYPTDGIAGFEVLNTTTRQGKLAHDVDEATMNAAIEFLRRKRDKPFLLVVSFINPHDICLLAGEASPLLDEVWKRYQPPAGAELPPLPANFGDTGGPARGIQPQTPARRAGTRTTGDATAMPTTAWWRTWTGRSARCCRPCARPARRTTRSSSSPAITARAWARTAGPAR